MKLPNKRVPSDDCAVYLGRVITDGKITTPGTPHYIHESEWVEIPAVQTIAQMSALVRLQSKLTGAATDAEALDAFDNICTEVSRYILAWNWTDNNGTPLPPPHGDTEAIKSISSDELAWLIRILSGETPGERKNA